MLKQLSVPKKIFGAITLLSAICYVGTMVYVHDTSADRGKDIYWVYYKARVNNITRHEESPHDTLIVNTVHTVRYHNLHNHPRDFLFRHSPQWQRVTGNGPVVHDEDNTPETTVEGPAYGTHVTYRSMEQHLTSGIEYKAGAYTNLFYNDWDNDRDNLIQAEIFTDAFTIDSFVIDSVPTVPVEDTEYP